MFCNFVEKHMEKHEVERIPEAERRSRESSLFFLWFASNLTIGDLALGFLFASFGIPLYEYIISALIGNILGGTMLSLMSVTGKVTAQPQMITGTRAFGKNGMKVMSGLQWGNTIGWLTFNTIIAAYALTAVMRTGNYYYISILIISVVVFLLALLGHNIVQRFERYMSVILGILFIYMSIEIVKNGGLIASGLSTSSYSVLDAAVVVALSFSYIMSWGPYAADYSRYVPSSGSSKKVFAYSFVGSVTASFWVETVGFLVAVVTGITAATIPSEPIEALLGSYAAVGLITIVFGGLSANALNLYSNSLSMRTVGIKLKRIWALILVLAISVTLAVVGYRSFYLLYEDFLYLLDYWITPWLGVMIADFFIVRSADVNGLSHHGFNTRGIASYILGIAISVPFMNPGSIINEMPISYLLGGVDISYFISFSVSLLLYWLFSKVPVRIKSYGASLRDGSDQ
ncbi:MAG: cytosine permease [Thermoplasmataceae archaeon]|jgi:NCS1 family nucleobase:cation symporter-1